MTVLAAQFYAYACCEAGWCAVVAMLLVVG